MHKYCSQIYDSVSLTFKNADYFLNEQCCRVIFAKLSFFSIKNRLVSMTYSDRRIVTTPNFNFVFVIAITRNLARFQTG